MNGIITVVVMRNIDAKDFWGNNSPPDTSSVFRSCMGYSNTPGWAFLRREVEDQFGSFMGLKTIELGCGVGKVSLLFSLLGATTTLVDYSPKQLKRAKYIADKFNVKPVFLQADLLQLPKSFLGQYDISMSFGTAEHFFLSERQAVFDAHYNVLRKGGMSIIWVPNLYGFLFHLGVTARKLFKRPVCTVNESPFTKRELFQRAKKTGLSQIRIVGAGSLKNDFFNHVFDIRCILKLRKNQKIFYNAQDAKNELLESIARNNASIRPWNNFFSYPLILIGRNI
jgi:2-polyprenyl-3-methyl-5-hydroxy-6-metoxy-1,4-benzoquinol methylase